MNKCPYWSVRARSHTKEARTFQRLGMVALGVLRSFPKATLGSIIQVCGPVSTGGLGSVKLNFLILSEAVRMLRVQGEPVFDQTPLEEQIVPLWEDWTKHNKGYCWPLLEEVYRPLFESGLIGTLLFLPGWESSVGSCWERSMGLSLHMAVHPYPADLYKKILEVHSLQQL